MTARTSPATVLWSVTNALLPSAVPSLLLLGMKEIFLAFLPVRPVICSFHSDFQQHERLAHVYFSKYHGQF